MVDCRPPVGPVSKSSPPKRGNPVVVVAIACLAVVAGLFLVKTGTESLKVVPRTPEEKLIDIHFWALDAHVAKDIRSLAYGEDGPLGNSWSSGSRSTPTAHGRLVNAVAKAASLNGAPFSDAQFTYGFRYRVNDIVIARCGGLFGACLERVLEEYMAMFFIAAENGILSDEFPAERRPDLLQGMSISQHVAGLAMATRSLCGDEIRRKFIIDAPDGNARSEGARVPADRDIVWAEYRMPEEEQNQAQELGVKVLAGKDATTSLAVLACPGPVNDDHESTSKTTDTIDVCGSDSVPSRYLHSVIQTAPHELGWECRTFFRVGSTAFSMALSPISDVLVIGTEMTLAYRGPVSMYDAKNGSMVGGHLSKKRTKELNEIGTVTSVAYAPDGQTFATCSQDSTLRIWDGQPSSFGDGNGPKLLRTITWPRGICGAVAFTPDSTHILGASRFTNEAYMFKTKTGKEWSHGVIVNSMKLGPPVENTDEGDMWYESTGIVHEAVFSNDGKTLFLVTTDGFRWIWSLGSGYSRAPKLSYRIHQRRGSFQRPAMFFVDDDQYIFSDTSISKHDMTHHNVSLPGKKINMVHTLSAAISHNKKFFAVASLSLSDVKVTMYDTVTLTALDTFPKQAADIIDLCFSRDDTILYSLDETGAVKTYSTPKS